MTWIAVAVGGALGSLARHAVNLLLRNSLAPAVPYATFVVNVLGCVTIGALAGAIAGGRLHMTPVVRAFVFVGILGGFTTFSTFGLDSFTLAHEGQRAAALWNVAGQVGLGLGGVWVGFLLGS